jgi:hypothetical protein
MRPQEPNVDRVIDEVAREMMSAEAPASMRAAVLARVEGRRRPLAVGAWRWAWVPAAAIGAAVLAGVWLDQPRVSPIDRAPVQTVAAEAPGTVVPAGPAVADAGLAGVNKRTAAASRQAAVLRARVAPADFPDAAPPLGTVDPIAFERIDPDELALRGIGVEPLSEPSVIDVPSLDPGSPDKRQFEQPERD